MPAGSTPHRKLVTSLPLLNTQAAPPPDLILHWNEAAELAPAIDVVVHFHGFAKEKHGGPGMRLDCDMEPVSGLDMADPASPLRLGRIEPTLCILPRGQYVATAEERTFEFPTLLKPENLERLIDFALASFRPDGKAAPVRRRLLLTAHSGGGKAILDVLKTRIKDQVDEVHLYDALYWDAQPLKNWLTARIQAKSATSAMRVIFFDGPKASTIALSIDVATYLDRLKPGALDRPGGRYRVERTSEVHMKIPPTFGWQILRDAGSDLLPKLRPARGALPRLSAVVKPAAPSLDASPLRQSEIDALSRIVFSNAGDVELFFAGKRGKMDFTYWFNGNLRGKPPFVRDRAAAMAMPDTKAARKRFGTFWDSLSQAYGRPEISALEFATLTCIVLNETSGDFGGRVESSGKKQAGRADSRGAHPGLAYFFDEIELAPGRTKTSYNLLRGNRPTGQLLDDATFIQAHGAAGGAKLYARNGKAFGNAWNSAAYPQSDVSTDEAAPSTEIIREADFYKFRGRGIIQTTGRAAYLPYVTFVQSYSGRTKSLVDCKRIWSDLPTDTVLTQSRTADWDALFTTGEVLARALAFHANPTGKASKDYRLMSLDATVLNDVPTPTEKVKNPTGTLGSIFAMGRAISGSYAYGSSEYRSRVLALLHAMLAQ